MRGIRKHDVPLHIIKFVNVLLMAIPFAIVWYMYYSKKIEVHYYTKGHWAVIAVFVLFYFIFGRIYDAFLVSINKISEMIYSQVLSLIAANVFMYIFIWLISRYLPNPGYLFLALDMEIVISVLWCNFAHRWYYRRFKSMRTVIIYRAEEKLSELIESHEMDKKFNIEAKYTVKECINNIDLLRDFRAVFISGVDSNERNIILNYCVMNKIDVYTVPNIGDLIMRGASNIHMLHMPIFKIKGYHPTPEYLIIKRCMDIIISGIVLIPAGIVMIITAILIKKQDGGPVLYKQMRLTKNGRKFNVLKFRSMRVDAEKDGVARLSTGENDDRITPVGKVIRKYRIDELPQLINILKGDMSIVGPRPERPEIADEYCKTMPEFALRLQAKAGLTGYAQVYGKYNSTPFDKLRMDLIYISNPSTFEDLKICFATVKILFQKESTEGIEEGKVTAGDKD